MTNRMEVSGVVLEGPPYLVDGEPMRDVRHAVETFMARLYPHNAELPRELRRYIRRFAGNQLCAPFRMVRRARGDMTQAALAKASGVSKSTISRIERGKSNPTASVLFNITHAAAHR